VHAGGHIIERQLAPGEVLHIDTGCVVAYTKDVDFDVQMVGGIKNTLFGGEGFFFAVLRGPGKVWLQTLPISRLASRIVQYSGPNRKEEGSVLGGLGNLLDGDGF
ncbi:MAG TPA: AIM24 family protein, partial [Chitinophagales bacterium]|nr:AIM24 family protein [Chitinophagales bacterium]